jgi:fluoroquinolone transport system permease protein
MNKVLKLSSNDLRQIRRDPMLMAVLFGPILLMILVRYGIPEIDKLTLKHFEFSMLEYDMLILGFFMLLIPFLVGILVGLLILDDRDEGMIVFYSVTPLGRKGYLMYRLASPVFLSAIFTFLMGWFNGIAYIEMAKLLASVLLFSLEAPLIALVMVSMASNKVEGLAVTKGLGVILAFPFLVHLVHSSWIWAGSIIPTFWASQTFATETMNSFSFLATVIGGIFVHILFIWILMNRFIRQAN